jgi:hypothetical protein
VYPPSGASVEKGGCIDVAHTGHAALSLVVIGEHPAAEAGQEVHWETLSPSVDSVG